MAGLTLGDTVRHLGALRETGEPSRKASGRLGFRGPRLPRAGATGNAVAIRDALRASSTSAFSEPFMLPTDVFPSDRDFIAFCECDSNWGPLLFLRPEPDQRMSVLHTAFGAILLGVPFGLFATIVLTVYAHVVGRAAPALFQYPLLLSLGYWLTAQLTLARAWNRRVQRRGQ